VLVGVSEAITSAPADHKAVAIARSSPAVAKSTYSPRNFEAVRLRGDDFMPATQTDLLRSVLSIVPSDIPALSDDECLVRLAQAVAHQDSEHLDEVARLIGRLAVTIE
jgi:hypothetical protein